MSDSKLMTLPEAAAWLHKTFGIRRTAKTIWWWIYYGEDHGAVRLETVVLMGRYHVTGEGLRRYLRASTRLHNKMLDEEAVDAEEEPPPPETFPRPARRKSG